MAAAPINLRCEYSANPIGIDAPRPQLSWQLPAGVQTAYRIFVATSEDRLVRDRADVWDSGKVVSDQSMHVAYGGPPLSSGTRVWWKVRVWVAGRALADSLPGFWETGLLNPYDWSARWIRPDAPIHLNRPGAAYLRKTFHITKPIVKARLYVTARGIYVASLNGRRVSDDMFRPGWTCYNKRLQYQTYNVTDMLRPGANGIGLVLNKGWYAGEVAWREKIWGENSSVLAQLVVTHRDGSTTTIGTDQTWKSAAGAIVTSTFLAGETQDARLDLGRWTQADYADARWHNVSVEDPPAGRLVAQVGPSIRRLIELRPKTIKAGKLPGTALIDMGQNMVGYVRLRVKGPAGTVIVLRHAEVLEADGHLYVDNLRRARAIDQYTLTGAAEGETLEPTFTFHGFRFVEISGYPGGLPKPEDIVGVVIGSATPPTGQFECGVGMLNQLQHNIQWGQRGNFVEVPTDCPQRDERLGWMGDIQVFARTATFNADVASFLTKWLDDVVDSQTPEGKFPDVAPVIPNLDRGSPAWGDAGCIVPWVLFERYGDKRILERMFEPMRAWVDYVHTANRDLLWVNKTGNNYGDWLSINADTPKEVLATAYFAHSATIVADSARVIGNKAAEKHYAALAKDIRTAFTRAYTTPDGRVRGDTQTAYLVALHFSLVPDALRPRILQRLVEDIHNRKDHLSTGFVGVSYLLPTLADNGHFDLAVKLLLNETFPSWGFSVRHGATTIWERWDGWTPEKGFQTPGMNSFNHYAYGSCGDFMYRYLAGIAPDLIAPGYKRFTLRPRPHKALKFVKARYDSMYGPIESHWALEGESFTWKVTVPPNTSATAIIPGKPKPRLLGPGTYTIKA